MGQKLEKDLELVGSFFAMWDEQAYNGVTSVEAWNQLFGTTAAQHREVKKQTVVPIRVMLPDEYKFLVYVDEFMSATQQRYISRITPLYKFKSNGRAIISNLEFIGDSGMAPSPEEWFKIDLPAGEYAVQLYQMDYLNPSISDEIELAGGRTLEEINRELPDSAEAIAVGIYSNLQSEVEFTTELDAFEDYDPDVEIITA